METKWYVRVVRWNGSIVNEMTFNDYYKALKAFNDVSKLTEDQRELATGRVRLCSAYNTTIAHALVA